MTFPRWRRSTNPFYSAKRSNLLPNEIKPKVKLPPINHVIKDPPDEKTFHAPDKIVNFSVQLQDSITPWRGYRTENTTLDGTALIKNPPNEKTLYDPEENVNFFVQFQDFNTSWRGYWRVLEGTDGRKEEGKGGKKFSYLASLKSLVCSYLGWMLWIWKD